MSSTAPYPIRICGAGDDHVVSEILSEAAEWTAAREFPLWSPARLTPAAIRSDMANARYALALESGRAVGTVRFCDSDPIFWSDAASDRALYLHRLAVRTAYRGRSVTGALLEWAFERARSRGYEYVRLDCETFRTRLCALYEAHGFEYHSTKEIGGSVLSRYQWRVSSNSRVTPVG